jgi:glycosyltransferase involved in cell wall biosynthesis
VRWDDVPVEAFRVAQKVLGNLKLLIREPPSQVAEKLKHALDSGRFIILPTTTCRDELRLTTASMDAVLHYSKIGESFGYGVAEPMNLGRPAIVNYLPWMNLGQVELARHRECGYAVTNTTGLTRAILSLGGDAALRRRFGDNARRHIRQLADPATSLDRLEMAFACAVGGQPNPTANEDAIIARQMAEYLTDLKFGDTWRDRLALMPFYYRVRFHQWRQVMKRRLATRNIQ